MPSSLHQTGRDALRSGRLAEAQELLRAALEGEAKNAEARRDLGWAYYRANDFERAAPVFEKLPDSEAMVAKLRSFSGSPPYELHGPQETTVPFLRTDPLPVVHIAIQGRETWALIDTGAGELLLDVEFAREIGATEFGVFPGTLFGAELPPATLGRVEEVALGEMKLRRVPVRLGPIRQLSLSEQIVRMVGGRYELNAIIGTTLLAQFRPTIDYPAQQLVLRQPADETAQEGTEVPFQTIEDYWMFADGSLNGVGPLRFFVDSGVVGGDFTCPERTLKAAGIPVPATSQQGAIDPAGGGPIWTGQFHIDELGLGPLRQRNLTGIFTKLAPDPEPAPDWVPGLDGYISHGFLRRYRWTIDFARSVFVFSE